MKRLSGNLKEDIKKIYHIEKTEDHWVNKDNIIIEYIPYTVSPILEDIMFSIRDRFKDDEFSIYSKSYYDETQRLVIVGEDYYIPKQEVLPSSIEYKEDPPNGFNTIIHRHPHGCSNFSTTDETYINQNHDFSFLWIDSFIKGQMRFKTPFGMMKIPLKIIRLSRKNINIIGIDKISKKQFPMIYSGLNNEDLYKTSISNIYKQHNKDIKKGFINQETSDVYSSLSDENNDVDQYVDEIEEIMLRDGIDWNSAVQKHYNKYTKTEFEGI